MKKKEVVYMLLNFVDWTLAAHSRVSSCFQNFQQNLTTIDVRM
jgi:hypothetical protein